MTNISRRSLLQALALSSTAVAANQAIGGVMQAHAHSEDDCLIDDSDETIFLQGSVVSLNTTLNRITLDEDG